MFQPLVAGPGGGRRAGGADAGGLPAGDAAGALRAQVLHQGRARRAADAARPPQLTRSSPRELFERDEETERVFLLQPKSTSLEARLGGDASEGFVAFVRSLLAVDPAARPSAEEALRHPWLQEALEEPE